MAINVFYEAETTPFTKQSKDFFTGHRLQYHSMILFSTVNGSVQAKRHLKPYPVVLVPLVPICSKYGSSQQILMIEYLFFWHWHCECLKQLDPWILYIFCHSVLLMILFYTWCLCHASYSPGCRFRVAKTWKRLPVLRHRVAQDWDGTVVLSSGFCS